MDLDYLPPELIVHVGRFLTRGPLATLLRVARRYNELLASQVYDPESLAFRDPGEDWPGEELNLDSIRPFDGLECVKHWRSLYILSCFDRMPLEAMAVKDEYGWTWAHLFAYFGNIPLLKIALAKGLEVDMPTRSGESLLFLATRGRQLPAVNCLLKAGADMWKANGGPNSFTYAIGTGEKNLVLLFVEAVMTRHDNLSQLGAAPNSSLLTLAIPHPPILVLLLANGADPFATSSSRCWTGQTPLHRACYVGATEAAEVLIRVMKRHNGGLSIPNPRGNTPLHTAISHFGRDRRSYICRKLLKAGADPLAVNNVGQNAMDLAILQGNKPVFKTLLKYGPPVWPSKYFTNKFFPPYCPASRQAYMICLMSELVEAGKISFNWSLQDHSGYTALHHACLAIAESDTSSFKQSLLNIDRLLDNGASPDIQDYQYLNTPLHIFLGSLPEGRYPYPTIKRLFPTVTNHPKNRWGYTSLHRATWYGYAQVTADILRHCDQETICARTIDGDTILHTAATGEGKEHVVQQALQAGLDASARNNIGMTPLHLAASYPNSLPAVRLLVETGGADVSAFDYDGNYPLHYAAQTMYRSNYPTICYLIGRGAASHEPGTCDKCDRYVTPVKNGSFKPNLNEYWNTKCGYMGPDFFAELDAPTIWGDLLGEV